MKFKSHNPVVPKFCSWEGCPKEATKTGGRCNYRLPFGQAYYGPDGTPCGRWVCTPTTPWDRDKGRAIHPWAREKHNSQRPGYPGGDIVEEGCPVCGHRWERELPQ